MSIIRTQEDIDEFDKILDKHAKENMSQWNLKSFKNTHYRLYKSIIRSMFEVKENKKEI